MPKKERIRKYSSYDTDFCETRDQNFNIPENYRWLREKNADKLLSAVLYAIALLFSFFYLRFFLKIRIKGREKLKCAENEGIFLYANHTQPVGDVFLPAFACFPKRIYTVVSRANLAIPVVGKLLPYLGALPIADSISGMAQMSKAIKKHISDKRSVVIYPEAHVWEYYTGIRPFSNEAFLYPARLGAPVYCMTLTYKKSKRCRRPRAYAHIDGPFFAEGKNAYERSVRLFESVLKCMNERSKESDCEYIVYEKATDHKRD